MCSDHREAILTNMKSITIRNDKDIIKGGSTLLSKVRESMKGSMAKVGL